MDIAMALEIEVRSKLGPKTYQRFTHRINTEEVTQAELIRRALVHYFDFLDRRELELVSLMQRHAETTK